MTEKRKEESETRRGKAERSKTFMEFASKVIREQQREHYEYKIREGKLLSSSAIREDTDSTSNPTWPYNRLFSHGLNKYISLECSRRTTLFPTPSALSVNSLACLDADPSLKRQFIEVFIEVGRWLGDPFLWLLF